MPIRTISILALNGILAAAPLALAHADGGDGDHDTVVADLSLADQDVRDARAERAQAAWVGDRSDLEALYARYLRDDAGRALRAGDVPGALRETLRATDVEQHAQIDAVDALDARRQADAHTHAAQVELTRAGRRLLHAL